ncbi:hypothetical protein Droror1_Dr00015361 [Drosera rotundifolia]
MIIMYLNNCIGNEGRYIEYVVQVHDLLISLGVLFCGTKFVENFIAKYTGPGLLSMVCLILELRFLQTCSSNLIKSVCEAGGGCFERGHRMVDGCSWLLVMLLQLL